MNPVLVLGAGINGAAVARDLVLNGVPVILADRRDIACGATSRSSRLIHGGLRYLEYRDFALVRESLAERERLLRTAPQFVRPLRLQVPVRQRLGGLLSGASHFTGLSRTSLPRITLPRWMGRRGSARGLWAVKFGLTLYDWLAGDSSLPKHGVTPLPQDAGWVCEFSDAQMVSPERFVLSLLHDAQATARENGLQFEIHPHCEFQVVGSEIQLRSRQTASPLARAPLTIRPIAIVNATGAWGDRTLNELGCQQGKLFAGTKGSHLFTHCSRLTAALAGRGIYAEASDGRLVFILPCRDGVLIGTTDEPFESDPHTATATSSEVAYLVNLVNHVLPDVALRIDEIEMHHAGVRPLPRVSTKSAAAIPRGHSIHESMIGTMPVLTLIGGKLTTCRVLAEQVASRILQRVDLSRTQSTADRPLPGAAGMPRSPSEHATWLAAIASRIGLSMDQAQRVLELVGNRFDEIFPEGTSHHGNSDLRPSLAGTCIPLDFIRWSIQHEWCYTLEDLVERRLLLIFEASLSCETLEELGRLLVEAGCFTAADLPAVVESQRRRLVEIYGKKLEPHE